jgi:hypothetical protein
MHPSRTPRAASRCTRCSEATGHPSAGESPPCRPWLLQGCTQQRTEMSIRGTGEVPGTREPSVGRLTIWCSLLQGTVQRAIRDARRRQQCRQRKYVHAVVGVDVRRAGQVALGVRCSEGGIQARSVTDIAHMACLDWRMCMRLVRTHEHRLHIQRLPHDTHHHKYSQSSHRRPAHHHTSSLWRTGRG